MSFYYTNIINQNLAMYSQLKKTEPCAENFQCVTNCLTDIFHFHKNRTYTCKTITHMYVLRFMNRYSSEVYHIFSDLLPRLNNNDLILSLGCGPSFETVALEKYSRDNSIGKIRYLGIDSNQIWEDVSASCCLCTQNIESRVVYRYNANLSDVLPLTKVFLLNYCLSDIKNHSDLEFFLNNDFSLYLSLLPHDSFVVINDQNHGDEWEDIFDLWKKSLNPTQYEVNNFFYDPGFPKRCNPRGKRMATNKLIFSNSGLNSTITDYFQEHLPCCESGITIIHKL